MTELPNRDYHLILFALNSLFHTNTKRLEEEKGKLGDIEEKQLIEGANNAKNLIGLISMPSKVCLKM
jgi:hypothetical protein